MNAVKVMIGIAAGIAGVAGMTASVIRADTFLTNFSPAPELHGTGGGNTSASFAAAAMMGAYGHSDLQVFTNWEASIRAACATMTGASVWPGSCNPTGMAQALASLTGRSWCRPSGRRLTRPAH